MQLVFFVYSELKIDFNGVKRRTLDGSPAEINFIAGAGYDN